jgi:hypothetical protein
VREQDRLGVTGAYGGECAVEVVAAIADLPGSGVRIERDDASPLYVLYLS